MEQVLLARPASTLTLINVHPTLTPKDMQVAAVALVLERLKRALSLGNHNNASAPAAVIVAGDFNIGPEEPMLDELYGLLRWIIVNTMYLQHIELTLSRAEFAVRMIFVGVHTLHGPEILLTE